jgi:hypothetical protein
MAQEKELFDVYSSMVFLKIVEHYMEDKQDEQNVMSI